MKSDNMKDLSSGEIFNSYITITTVHRLFYMYMFVKVA